MPYTRLRAERIHLASLRRSGQKRVRLASKSCLSSARRRQAFANLVALVQASTAPAAVSTADCKQTRPTASSVSGVRSSTVALKMQTWRSSIGAHPYGLTKTQIGAVVEPVCVCIIPKSEVIRQRDKFPRNVRRRSRRSRHQNIIQLFSAPRPGSPGLRQML